MPAPLVLGIAFLAGSVPFSQLAARRFAGQDLRTVGTGTVSGSGLYEVAGFGPLALAGIAEVGKGAIGPALAGASRPWLSSAATAACIVGHDWSLLLAGAGGRGVAPALGATAVAAPEGTVVLLASLLIGRGVHQSGFAILVGSAAVIAVLGWRRGAPGAALGAAIAAPMLAKRAAGNGPRQRQRAALRTRLLFDRDRAGQVDGACLDGSGTAGRRRQRGAE